MNMDTGTIVVAIFVLIAYWASIDFYRIGAKYAKKLKYDTITGQEGSIIEFLESAKFPGIIRILISFSVAIVFSLVIPDAISRPQDVSSIGFFLLLTSPIPCWVIAYLYGRIAVRNKRAEIYAEIKSENAEWLRLQSVVEKTTSEYPLLVEATKELEALGARRVELLSEIEVIKNAPTTYQSLLDAQKALTDFENGPHATIS